MSGIRKNYTSDKTQYTLTYTNSGGVDFSSGTSVGRERYSQLENMYRDYDGGGGDILESVPGFRRIKRAGTKVNRLFCQKNDTGEEFVVVHSNDGLYRFNINDREEFSFLSPIATVLDTKSSAFSSGSDLFILDGEKFTRIDGDGGVSVAGQTGALPYVPTTFVNGKEYQQRNLLTDAFREKFTISSYESVAYGTSTLQYRITDSEKRFCALSGVDANFSGGSVYVPSYAEIGGEKYKVTEISDSALMNNIYITALVINEGIIKIGLSAFSGAKNLKSVHLPDTLAEIGNEAFMNCSSLSYLYMGAGVRTLGVDCFAGCGELKNVSYASSAANFKRIENYSELSASVIAGAVSRSVTVKIPIYTLAEDITKVTVDGTSVAFKTMWNNGYCHSILIDESDRHSLDGKTVEILGTASNDAYMSSGADAGLLSEIKFRMSGSDAVYKCRICESFDGRIFVSGNPELPNTVIYSERDDTGNNNPLYFGIYNYFSDGMSTFPVISMLATGDSLAVFKEDDDGCGSIFYHTPSVTEHDTVSKIYPTSYVHSGFAAMGESISFFDDPVFVSRKGICALEKKAINLERSIACRSHNVNTKLLCEDLSSISLAKWCGYLVVGAGERVYLADSRAKFRHDCGDVEYEWYFLDGVGDYYFSNTLHHYSSVLHSDELTIKEGWEDEALTPGTTYYYLHTDTETYPYVIEDGIKYEVYKGAQNVGGTFAPASAFLSIRDELLLFGTTFGTILIFNNDKRGVPPERISSQEDFDAEEYAALYGRKIHPDFYDFCGRAVPYVAKTAVDNCGIPHLAKSTVKHSLVLKCRMIGRSGALRCAVGTDRHRYEEYADVPNGIIDFSDLDFSSLALTAQGDVTLPIAEKEKGWVEKQISVSSSDFRMPIGIHSLSYRFTVKGRIKNNS